MGTTTPVVKLILLLLILMITVVTIPIVTIVTVLCGSPFTLFLPPLRSKSAIRAMADTCIRRFGQRIGAGIGRRAKCSLKRLICISCRNVRRGPDGCCSVVTICVIGRNIKSATAIVGSASGN